MNILKSLKISIKELFFSRYNFLLISLVLFITLLPLTEGIDAEILYIVFVFFILVGCVYTICQNKLYYYTSLFITVASVSVALLDFYYPEIPHLEYFLLTQPLFFILTVIIILQHILNAEKVTRDIVMGSICAYLLIGIAWALLYIFLYTFNSHSFSSPASTLHNSDLIYFSFITLTTTGYGDITPGLSFVKSMSVLEAITGQFYIAILVARLVALQIMHSRDDDSD